MAQENKTKTDSSKFGGRTEEDLPIITLKPQETMLCEAFLKPFSLVPLDIWNRVLQEG